MLLGFNVSAPIFLQHRIGINQTPAWISSLHLSRMYSSPTNLLSKCFPSFLSNLSCGWSVWVSNGSTSWRNPPLPNCTLTELHKMQLAQLSHTICITRLARRLLENPPIIITIPEDPYYQLKDKDCLYIVGSCNGLLCLFGGTGYRADMYREKWLRFWNPATRTIS